ncbi:MAG: zinc ribbon domain-containing protein [Lentisphaeria bacterium]|jgi:putative FmdB family regulatory protein|nr:zinc ribbon domain-containing protein [Lentisphaeria bacterium]
MPIFEYLCQDCNRIYSFLVKSPDAAREPVCPVCGATGLRKLISKFAIAGAERKSKTATPADNGGDHGGDALDDPRVEREMMKLMSEAEGIDESDPRQLGRLMRRMGEITGEPIEGEMAEAVRRLEAGEDPEKIEEDMGDLFGDDGAAPGTGRGAPTYDGGLYDL